jgi:DNA mismatch repair protein MutH
MKLPYNLSDKNSIIEYAKKLKGNSLREVCEKTVLEHNYAGKGNFGQVLEKFYFFYEPNSNTEPDFKEQPYKPSTHYKFQNRNSVSGELKL